MNIAPFGVEMWMNAHETRCTHNLAETCVASLTVAELLDLAGQNDGLEALMPMRLTYGAIEGSDRLRAAIAGLYADQAPGDVIVTHGTIGANALVYRAMIEPGDRVVSVVPTYQQHTAIPESLGADVVPLDLREADGWLPDLDLLRELVIPGTRMITLTNPNNPTGALIPPGMLAEICQIAREAGAWLLADEVYRGTDQEGGGMSPSVADMYERGIATAGMSKAFALAGLRLGWVVAPKEVLEKVAHHRDYDTISVGMIDDHLATLALEAKDRLLDRSRAITRRNLAVLADWVDAEPGVGWVKPASGTVALLRFDLDVPSEVFCVDLLAETGVLMTPGSAFGMEGYVRIGFANHPEVLAAGLPLVSAFLAARR